jgi:CheY-like chemotaxis protein
MRTTGHALVLVADDEAHIRMVVADKLRSLGYEVLEAPDGEEALELATTHKPDAVVTDLQMPFMNGLELCTRLRELPETAGAKAILLTARGHILSDEQLSKTIIREVMSKPFSAREVAAKLQALLSSGTGAAAGAPNHVRVVREAA